MSPAIVAFLLGLYVLPLGLLWLGHHLKKRSPRARGAFWGAVIGHWYNKRAAISPAPARAERLGTLVASGLIVGESLFGVLNAGLIVASSNDAPIALVPEDFAPAKIMGVLAFIGLVIWLYRWMLKRSEVTPGGMGRTASPR